MKRTYGGWAVNSLRTTMRIELISDLIRTHHRRDRSKENRRGRNWNRWHGSAAYIIDTSGKQPHEHAVKFPGRRKVDHYRCVPRPRGGRHTAFALLRDQPKATGGKRYLKPTPTPRSCQINFRSVLQSFWRTTTSEGA